MAGFDAGEIEGRLVLNRDAFNAGLDAARRDAESFEEGEYRARLGADSAEADAKLEDVRAKADEWDATDARAKLGADETDADAKIRELELRLDEFKSTVATKRVDVNDAAAKRKLADLTLAADAFGNEILNPRIDTARLDAISSEMDKLDAKLAESGSGLDQLAKKSDNASKAAGGLGAAVGALAPAIGTAGAVAAAGLVGILPAIATVGVGLAGFAVAAEGDLTSVKTQMAGVVHEFQQANAGNVIPALNGAIGLLSNTLTFFTPVTDATALGLSQLESSAASALGSPYWTGFSSFLGREATPALQTFGNLIGGLGTLFSGLTVALAPLTADVEQGLNQMAAHMARFGQTASANGGIESFINFVNNNSAVAHQAISAIAHDLALVAEDGAKVGPPMLEVVSVLANLVGDVESASPMLVEFATAGYAINRIWSLVPVSLKDVSAAVKDIGNFSGIASGAAKAEGPVGSLIGKLGSMRGALVNVSSAAAITAGAEMAVGEEGVAAAAGAELSWGAVLGPLALVAGALGLVVTLFHHSSSASQQASQDAEQYASSFVQGMQSAGQSVQQQEAAIRSQIQTLQGQEQAYILTAGAAKGYGFAAAANDPQVKGLQAKIAALNTELHNLQSQYQGSTAAAQQASSGTQTLQTYISSLGSTTSNASTDLSNLNSALAILAGNSLSAQGAVLNEQQAVYSFSTALTTAHGNLTGTSQASVAAEQSAQSFASSLYSNLIPALAQNGDSASQVTSIVQGVVSQFDQAASHAGLTAAQVAGLNSTYHLTQQDLSKAITILINSGEIAAAQNQTNSLTGALNSLNGRTYTAFVSVQEAISTYGGTGVSGNNALIRAGHASGLKAGSMGAHMAVVGELGPELMVHAGRVSVLGPKGPTVAHIPANAAILTAAQSAPALSGGHVAAHADGLAGTGLLGGFSPVVEVTTLAPNVTYAPHYTIPPNVDTKQLEATLEAHDQHLLTEIEKWLGNR